MACLAGRSAPDIYMCRARLEQRPQILAFQRAAIAGVPETYYSAREKAVWWRRPAAGLDELIANGRYFVIGWRDQLVAGGGWEFHLDCESALMRGVFVDPAWAGRGLGTRCICQVEADAVDGGRRRMIVPAALNAVRFYEKLGYVRGERAGIRTESVMLEYVLMHKGLVA